MVPVVRSGMREIALIVVLTFAWVVPAKGISCPTSTDEPLTICFDQQPLELDKCTKSVKLHFTVGRLSPRITYRYAFKVFLDGELQNVTQSAYSDFPFSTDIPYDLQSFPFLGNGKYSVEVTVTPHVGKEVSATSDPTLPPLTIVPKLHALIIGISRYDYGTDDATDAAHIHNLHFADKDARDFVELLNKNIPSDQLDLTALFNHDAQSTTITKWIATLTEYGKACGDDELLFFFSGHGVVDRQGYRYLGTADINVTDLTNSSILYAVLVVQLDFIRVKRLLVFDSCFSGFTVLNPSYVLPTGAKLQFTDGNNIVAPFPVALSDLQKARNTLTQSQYPLSAYSAASAEHVAEEIYVSDDKVYFPDQNDRPNSGTGNGLYTYFFVRALKSDLSKQSSGDCTFDFKRAFSAVEDDLKGLPTTRDLQRPDLITSVYPVGTLPCRIPLTQPQ